MKQIYKISEQEYDTCSYQIDKIISGQDHCIIVRNLWRSPYGVCAVIKYKDIGKTIDSPLLNWHNLVFCSNYYGPPPHPGYMNNAVQNGTKTASTAYVSSHEYKQLVDKLPANCHAVPYGGTLDNMSMAYVYRDGTLDELFGFKQIKFIYTSHNINNVDWDDVESQFAKPLEYFSDSTKCGFDIQHGARSNENKIVNGLLLGYPIESTIAYINNDYITFGDNCTDPKVRDHFKKSIEPYVDCKGMTWNKSDKTIYCDGQQEVLYY